MSDDVPVDKFVKPTLKAVARKGPWFTKAQVVREILRRTGQIDDIIRLRKTFPGSGFDILVMRSIETAVSRSLQARDGNGIRLYECYAAAGGERRWMTFRKMRATNIRDVLNECYALSAHIEAKIRFYELLLKELEHAGSDAQVDDIYDRIAIRRQMIEAARNQDVSFVSA